MSDKKWCAWCGKWGDHTSGCCPDLKAQSELSATPCSVTVICKAMFEVEAALDKLCAVLHDNEALQRETNMILVTFQQRRHALERMQRQSQNESRSPTAASNY